MIAIPEFAGLPQLLLWILVTALMPLAVGLLTKVQTPAYWKISLLLAMALANGVLTTWLDDFGAFDWKRAVSGAVMAWTVALLSHFGIWRPTGATAAAQNTLVTDRSVLPRAA